MLCARKFCVKSFPSSTSTILGLLHVGGRTVAYRSHASFKPFFPSPPSNKLTIIGETLVLQKFISIFSTFVEPVLVQAHDPSRVAVELESAVDECRFEDAWKAYEKHIHMTGFPRKSVLSKLVTGFAETCDAYWLNKAYSVVELIFEEKKHDLLEKEALIYLSFILAQCQLPVLSSNIVRRLVQIEAFPSLAAWSGIVGHLSQTATGAFLAAELIMEIGYLFKDNRVDPRKKSNRLLLSMKPNSFVFNLVLTGLLLFGTTRKAEQLLELMPRVGVRPDASLLIVMACIYEKNGHRDEIKKLKRHVDEACGLSDLEFQQFYECMLSCHLKFGDLDSAVDLVLDMLRKAKEAKRSLVAAKLVLEAVETRKKHLPYRKCEHEKLDSVGRFMFINSQAPTYDAFSKDSNFSRLEAVAKDSLQLLSDKLQAQVELVRSEHGILHPTERMYARLVRALLEADKISKLTTFLVTVSKEEFPVSIESSTVVQVINACISLGLLEQAHDLLDEMRFHGIRVGSSAYSSLLKAYCKENSHGEITTLLKDARQAGIQLDSSCYEALIQSKVHCDDSTGAFHLFKEVKDSNLSRSVNLEFEMLVEGCTSGGEAAVMTKLLEEIKDNQSVDCGVHDWNNVIHFFCKKRLMNDALKSLNKMRALGHNPNAQTFHSLVTAYAAIGGKYVEVTDLWGEMKLLASSSTVKFDQELLDSLLYCFVRGGFFLRAIEVIEMMERGNMFIDKYKYKSLWLKYHRTLYKGKAPKVQSEAQLRRREAALSFKRWIGLT
ncbi:pentatricopeptide repeat-containing protein At1g03100, mitochondrial [Typha latifolia]|uniref:pentatricopeptide repeat-containing protein At1g03100, mitochondrial n=1 Tax=Typha latifolia TaxID=4733 RepID=UPI003C2B5B5D